MSTIQTLSNRNVSRRKHAQYRKRFDNACPRNPFLYFLTLAQSLRDLSDQIGDLFAQCQTGLRKEGEIRQRLERGREVIRQMRRMNSRQHGDYAGIRYFTTFATLIEELLEELQKTDQSETP